MPEGCVKYKFIFNLVFPGNYLTCIRKSGLRRGFDIYETLYTALHHEKAFTISVLYCIHNQLILTGSAWENDSSSDRSRERYSLRSALSPS